MTYEAAGILIIDDRGTLIAELHRPPPGVKYIGNGKPRDPKKGKGRRSPDKSAVTDVLMSIRHRCPQTSPRDLSPPGAGCRPIWLPGRDQWKTRTASRPRRTASSVVGPHDRLTFVVSDVRDLEALIVATGGPSGYELVHMAAVLTIAAREITTSRLRAT
ncbi:MULTISPECIES: hypothetical protein [unclassified Microbacterium]|uniref:hypothetical protein n=1 Tax=unclassified Microbacterium TaxID=2609290 RepID=UPI00214B41EE|nr:MULTISPECIES: hypothetical protein [unclassified Microbacterium]MCR2811375.1 hypothetical protein [Microbacterium sp. zg.B185]WIM19579.1 hypothetical protein QNO12_01860 [Microbacterium sp. zg-B185]